MIPVTHIFYANETNSRGFNAVALFPLANGFTECVQLSHVDGIDEAMTRVNRECTARKINVHNRILAHKVSHSRVDAIRQTIRG